MRTILHLITTLVLVTSFGLFTPAVAQAETISVQIQSIAASSTGTSFDPSLESLRPKLQKAFGGYSNFQRVGDTTFTLKNGERQGTKLPDGSTINITFHGLAGKFIKLGLGVAGKLNTTLRASPGSTFFQAGLEYQDGILILAITVK
jgi:hypothetical protein